MQLQLDDKLALVTASTGGIGKEIAEVLAREGARVIVNGRTADTVDAAIDDIGRRVPGGRLEALVTNNGTQEGVEATVSAYPHIDVLVNNLGIYEAVDFFDITDEAWFEMFEVNVMSGVRLARRYLPKMLEVGSGRVVFLASEAAVMPEPAMVHYSASKTMVLGVSRNLAHLTRGTGVTVNAIVAGSTKTAGAVSFIGDLFPGLPFDEAEAAFMRDARPTSLIARLIQPREVADLVAYVSSPVASAINGASLRVDGGLIPTVA